MKTGLNKAFWLLSFVFVLGGLTILATRSTTAATSADYTTSFTVSKWRNYSGSSTIDGPIVAGPAEWRVTGTSGTTPPTNFCEIWQATGWDDAIPNTDSRGQFATYSYKGSSQCSGTSPITCNSGLYGISSSVYSNIFTWFGHSWPTGWQISGYINKSCP